MRRGRFSILALKDDRVEQCLRSCGVNSKCRVQSKSRRESHAFCVCIVGFSEYNYHTQCQP